MKKYRVYNKKLPGLCIHTSNSMNQAELWLKMHIAEMNWFAQKETHLLRDYEIREREVM